MNREHKTRGRPRTTDPRNIAVLTKFSEKEYDKLKILTKYYDISVQDVIRFAVNDLYNVIN